MTKSNVIVTVDVEYQDAIQHELRVPSAIVFLLCYRFPIYIELFQTSETAPV